MPDERPFEERLVDYQKNPIYWIGFYMGLDKSRLIMHDAGIRNVELTLRIGREMALANDHEKAAFK